MYDSFSTCNGNNTYDAGIDVDPVLEASGPDGSDGFANQTLGVADTPMAGYFPVLGFFFLRQPSPGSVPPPFIIDYNTAQTISALAGEIWDIDGMPGQGDTEQWAVQVLNAAGSPLAGQPSPLGDSSALDGLPWTFTFSGLPAGVDKVKITFVGSKTSGLGLAFNNFSPVDVPEPSTILLFSLGGAVLRSRLRRGSAEMIGGPDPARICVGRALHRTAQLLQSTWNIAAAGSGTDIGTTSA